MGTLISLFGVVLLFFLILSGLLLIVAPAVGQRLLRKTATFTGLFLVLIIAFNLIWGFIRSIDSIAPILAFAVLSLVAYLVREHRIGAGKRSERPHPVERTPVMPRHIPGDGQ
jgi:hypothetical protein